jgi:hypothetical protein
MSARKDETAVSFTSSVSLEVPAEKSGQRQEAAAPLQLSKVACLLDAAVAAESGYLTLLRGA